jgi:hypothetical protein
VGLLVKVTLWRVVAAAAAATVAAVHLPLIGPHLTEAPYIGIGFMLLSVAAAVLAVLLLVADTRPLWRGTLLVAALALTAFLLSRTLGLPMIQDDIGNWSDPLGIIAVLAEAAMVAVAIRQLATPTTRTQHRAAPGSRSDAASHNINEPTSGGAEKQLSSARHRMR